MARICGLIVVAVLLTAHVATAEIRESSPQETTPVSGSTSDQTYWTDIGYGTLAVITNVFYMPVKVGYAALGLPVGGLAYLLTAGDSEISDEIWGQSLGGDYVVTPKMLLGEQAIHFNGRPKE